MAKTNFTFLDKNSYDDFGILIISTPTITVPERNITTLDIPYRNGSLTVDEETYKDTTLSIECSTKGNITEKASQIAGWLTSGKGKLIISNDPTKYYNAQVVNKFDIATTLKILGKFIIVFNCEPFKYLLNEQIITLIQSGTINNIGNYVSEPIIKVYGNNQSGNSILTINGEQIIITNIGTSITIDSNIIDAYNDNGDNCNNKMNGEFPKLNVGANTINFSGNISKIEITPRWRF